MEGEGKIDWPARLGFGAGDIAQNLAYPAASMYLLFFYTEVVGLPPSCAAAIFLAAQIVDFVWNPLAGVLVDRLNPRAGKYRTWLLAAGLPFAALAALSFWNPFAAHAGMPAVAWSAATYIAFSMSFTLLNVAYGALGASLTRDPDELTSLTAVRIFLANAACFAASAGVPLIVAAFSGAGRLPWRMALFMGLGVLPSFVFMPLLPWLRRRLGRRGLFCTFAPVAVLGMAALYALSRAGLAAGHPGLVCFAQFVKASGIIVATGYMWALVPEVVDYSERITGRRLSAVINSIIGVFFRLGMAVGKILPGAVLAWTGYLAQAEGASPGKAWGASRPAAWLGALAIVALVSALALTWSFLHTKERLPAGGGEPVGLGEIWRELRRNKPLRVLSLFFALSFAMMSVGNASGAYFMNGLDSQSPLAQEGVRWLVCVIPAALMAAATAAICRYKV